MAAERGGLMNNRVYVNGRNAGQGGYWLVDDLLMVVAPAANIGKITGSLRPLSVLFNGQVNSRLTMTYGTVTVSQRFYTRPYTW